MKCYFIFIALITYSTAATEKQNKIVALIPVRNEQHIIKQCLTALSLYADAIVVLDDCSDDNTLEIIKTLSQECRIERILTKATWYRDEYEDRSRLLQAGREIGGTHFILIDADEMFTANCLQNNFLREKILKLNPGERLGLVWIQLWRSLDYYRHDNSCWSNAYGDFIFCDDGICSYVQEKVHTSRRTPNLNGALYLIEGYQYGLMHFQFVNWRNLLIKQAWYRCLEHILLPEQEVTEINKKYAPSKNEQDIVLALSPREWFEGYAFFDPSIFAIPEGWKEKQVLKWFKEYGKDYFAHLDIWDIDWDRNNIT
ncbi:MAG TPA: glycosyltransferase family 2 protein [Candidatus Babeliales bacterium]|nr:glycosyltransferase family 2 protein [Candidatus Babeliales bacterium]